MMREALRSLGSGFVFALLMVVWLVGCGGSPHSGAPDGGQGGGAGSGQGGAPGGATGTNCPAINVGSSGDPNAAATWSRPFILSHWQGPALWTYLASTAAIDSAERVYVTDAKSIFVADTTGVRTAYSASQLSLDFGTADYVISKIDMSPDDRLFVLVDLSQSSFTTTLFASDGQGHLRTFADFKSFWPNLPVISAVSSDYVLAPFDSLYCVTSNVVAPLPALGTNYWGSYGCADRAITNEPSGSFYFLPGCNGSPLLGGSVNGAAVSVLSNLSDLGENYFLNFSSVARAPHGGSIVSLDAVFYYFDQTKTHIRLSTSPSIAEVRAVENGGDTDFLYCVDVVGPSNTIYIVCPAHIYRAVPQ